MQTGLEISLTITELRRIIPSGLHSTTPQRTLIATSGSTVTVEELRKMPVILI